MELIGHLDEEELERYSLSISAESELSRIEEHLLVCAACRERVEATDVYVRSMHHEALLLRQEPERMRKWWSMPRLLLLAGVACLLATVVVLTRRTGPPFAISLAATRGTGIEAQAPAGVPLALQLDTTGLPAVASYQVKMVDRAGEQVWTGTFPGKNVKPVPAGIYFVRLYSPAGELLREYGLEVGPRQ